MNYQESLINIKHYLSLLTSQLTDGYVYTRASNFSMQGQAIHYLAGEGSYNSFLSLMPIIRQNLPVR